MHAFFIAGIVACLLAVGVTATDAWAAQLIATVNPNQDQSQFKMSYLKTIHIWYQNGGMVADELSGVSVVESGMHTSENPDVQSLIDRLNNAIFTSGSQAQISDLAVDYSIRVEGGEQRASIDYKVVLDGTLTNYVITKDTQRTLVDLHWRGMTVDGSVNVAGDEINDPFAVVEENFPVTADAISGTTAERIFDTYLLNADFILEQPLENWHFLFDSTGINADASQFGLSEELAGSVRSSWTMGESSLREGRQVERIDEETIMLDQEYTIKSTQSTDQGNIHVVGFGVIDSLDGIEIAGVTPQAPEGFTIDPTGGFPIFIIYGMAGLAAVAGIAFFFVSNRSLKNEKQGQQGVDPAHLVGYQTSSASGGYQTNRGEAQLRDASDYQQTRSYYEEQSQAQQEEVSSAAAESIPTIPEPLADATCGCATSVEMGSECDCDMQGSCICDNTCPCNSALCTETANSMR